MHVFFSASHLGSLCFLFLISHLSLVFHYAFVLSVAGLQQLFLSLITLNLVAPRCFVLFFSFLL